MDGVVWEVASKKFCSDHKGSGRVASALPSAWRSEAGGARESQHLVAAVRTGRARWAPQHVPSLYDITKHVPSLYDITKHFPSLYPFFVQYYCTILLYDIFGVTQCASTCPFFVQYYCTILSGWRNLSQHVPSLYEWRQWPELLPPFVCWI